MNSSLWENAGFWLVDFQPTVYQKSTQLWLVDFLYEKVKKTHFILIFF